MSKKWNENDFFSLFFFGGSKFENWLL